MKRNKVLLVGWDAADWKVINPLMDQGKMPNVQKLIERGAMGQIATLSPPLSPMLWTSIATGKRPFRHGIHGFSEPGPDGRTVQPVSNLSRKCKAVWNILNQNDLRSIVIGWWPSHPAEPINGVTVSDHYHRAPGPLAKGWPLLANAVHPPELADQLAAQRFHPEELIPEMVEPFIPLAREIDQDKDRRVAGMMKTLCECVSIHGAATWLLDNQTWDFFAVYYDAIDHFCHGFMKYHPPRQSWITERDFELYSNVVNMAYQLHDQMLGVLLAKAQKAAGDDLHVILMSDHGFHPDHLRPRSIPSIPAGPAIEHREFGILAMAGPNIRHDHLLYGASVLDITPTILSIYDLPVGADMDGRVLAGAFENPPANNVIPSWEEVPGNDGRHPPHTRMDPVAAHEALEQMIALGYIERPAKNAEKAVENTIRELNYNLGEAYQDDNRHSEAHAIFKDLRAADPDETRYSIRLFVSCQALSLTEEMREIVDDLDGRRRRLFLESTARLQELFQLARERREERKATLARPKASETGESPKPKHEPLLSPQEREEAARCRNLARYQPAVVDYLRSQVLTAEKRWPEALESLGLVKDADLARPTLLLHAGLLYSRMNRWAEAAEVYEKALQIDPDSPQAHLGMCRVHLRRRRYAAAAQSALNALQRAYQNPMGHFLLGLALIGRKDFERAADAMRVALAMNPNFPEAHRRLAMLLRNRLDDEQGALEHQRMFRETRRRTRKRQAVSTAESAAIPASSGIAEDQTPAPPLSESIVIASGLPRSGTSMIMQMLAAGGLDVVTDNERTADEDNPRGYLEDERVKNLAADNRWLAEAKGKALKVVAPLLTSLAPGLTYSVILIERDLNEVLDSQAQMLVRRSEDLPDTPERRDLLKRAFASAIAVGKAALARRPGARLLVLQRNDVLRDPNSAAARINAFLGGTLDEVKMAAVVDPALHRQRRK